MRKTEVVPTLNEARRLDGLMIPRLGDRPMRADELIRALTMGLEPPDQSSGRLAAEDAPGGTRSEARMGGRLLDLARRCAVSSCLGEIHPGEGRSIRVVSAASRVFVVGLCPTCAELYADATEKVRAEG